MILLSLIYHYIRLFHSILFSLQSKQLSVFCLERHTTYTTTYTVPVHVEQHSTTTKKNVQPYFVLFSRKYSCDLQLKPLSLFESNLFNLFNLPSYTLLLAKKEKSFRIQKFDTIFYSSLFI